MHGILDAGTLIETSPQSVVTMNLLLEQWTKNKLSIKIVNSVFVIITFHTDKLMTGQNGKTNNNLPFDWSV